MPNASNLNLFVLKLKQKSREARGHVSGEQSAKHRAETDFGHFAATFGREQSEKVDGLKFHLFFANVFASLFVNVRMQNADERQVAITLGEIKSVTDDKKIRHAEADVIGLDFFDATRRFVEKHADFYPARLERAEFWQNAAHGFSRV